MNLTAPAAEAARTLPFITDANRHFWCGGADGRLWLLRCDTCGVWIHPFAARCRACGASTIVPQAVSGRGTVVGFTVNYQAWLPDVPVPYVVALVELEEQPNLRLLTNMPRTPFDEVRMGLSVKVYFVEADRGIHVPLFEAAL